MTTRTAPAQARWQWPYEGNPFDAAAANEDPDGDGTLLAYPLRFPGQVADADTGLHYNYFREYEPAIGRFIESDPIGLDGGINTYLYGKGNPLFFVDPRGLAVRLCCREAQILAGLVDHCWIKTDTKVAGMGNSPSRCTRPGDANSDSPFSPVYVQPHDCEPTDNCRVVDYVYEDCVNEELAVGESLGRFTPWNNCQTFAASVLVKCRVRSPGGRQDA